MTPKKSKKTSKLFGRYHVTPSPSAIRDAIHLFPRMGDYQDYTALVNRPGGTH